MKNLKNGIALLAANAFSSLAQYAVVVLIARAVGPEALGEYLFAWTCAWLLVVLCSFGLDRIVIRDVVRQADAASSVFTAAMTIRVSLGIVAIGLADLVGRVFLFSPSRRGLVVLLVTSLVLTQVTELLRSLFFAAGAMQREAVLRSLGRVVMLAAVAWSLGTGGGLRTVGVALVLAAIVELAVYLLTARARLGIRFVRVDRFRCARLALDALPIAINTLLVLLYFRANVMMLTAWRGAEAAGWFGAAFTFIQALQLVSGTLASVLLPALVERQGRGERDFTGSIRALGYYLLLFVVPVAVALAFMGGDVIRLVYGEDYEWSVPALQVLAWAPIFMFLGSLYGTLLVVLDRQMGLMWTSVVAVIVSLGLNWWWIPRFGIVGASWATVITEACVAALSLALASRRLPGIAPGMAALKPLGVGAAMALAVWSVSEWSWSVRGGVLVTVAFAGVVAFRAVPANQWSAAVAALRGEGKGV